MWSSITMEDPLLSFRTCIADCTPRLYGEIGAGVTFFQRVEFFVEKRKAIGNRWVPAADLSKRTITNSNSLGLRWVLR